MQSAFRLAAWAVLVVAATPCACAASVAVSSPAILRTDAFVAAEYDTNTALVFFSSSALVLPGLGAPAGAWPPMSRQAAAQWAGEQTHLRLAGSNGEAQWRHYWPGGEGYAPKLGGAYVLALGGNRSVRGTLSSIGYLTVCEQTWLVGLVSVDEVDRSRYAGSMEQGMTAYPAIGGAPQNTDYGSGQSAPAVGSTVGNDLILSVYPLSALPMLDQGDGDSGNQTIVLTEQHGTDSVIYSLKRVTSAGLVPAGVYFENRCRLSSTQ
jgi:hypothetical protein